MFENICGKELSIGELFGFAACWSLLVADEAPCHAGWSLNTLLLFNASDFKFKSYWFGGVVWLTGWFCDMQGEQESRLGSSSGNAARQAWVC